jgi:modulator of FtsH protease HflC
MLNPNQAKILGVAVAATLFTLAQTFFIVPETHQAMVLQFGKFVRTVPEAGLHLKVPFLQQVALFEQRVLDVDPEPERVLLASNRHGLMARIKKDASTEATDKADDVSGEPIMVDTFARYRITNPLQYRQRLGSEDATRLRLGNALDSITRDVLGQSTLEQLLSPRRAALMADIKTRINKEVQGLGIEVLDVRINRADLTENLREATFSRMRSEREQRAAEIRSMGEKRATEIKADADKQRRVLLAEAEKQAQIERGKGDEKASRISAEAYNQDPEFYAFYRSLQAYRQTLGKETTMVLNPESDFFRYLKR